MSASCRGTICFNLHNGEEGFFKSWNEVFFLGGRVCEVVFRIHWLTFGQNTASRVYLCDKCTVWLCCWLHHLMVKTDCKVLDTNWLGWVPEKTPLHTVIMLETKFWKPLINFYPTEMGILTVVHGLWKMWVWFEQKKIKLWNKRHFVENKREIMQCVLKME
jgi:hypothetical protein